MAAGKQSENTGFTLIELLVAIAVAVVLATIAVPNFQGLISRNQQVAEYNQVLTGLNYARSEAVKVRDVVSAEVFDDSGKWGMRIVHDSHVVKTFSASNGRLPFTVVKIDFNALGRREDCNQDPCQVEIGELVLSVNSAGNVGRVE